MDIELRPNTPAKVRPLVTAILKIMADIGVPTDGTPRSLERMAKACLAIGRVTEKLSDAIPAGDGDFMRTRDIIEFENRHLGEQMSPGSYDDIRRKDLKYPLEAGIVLSSSAMTGQATNNPSRGYALSGDFAQLLHAYGTENWDEAFASFKAKATNLREELARKRELDKIPLTLPDGKKLALSFGSHNDLQKAVIEDFLPRFGFGANVLYVGDTDNKFLLIDRKALQDIGFFKLEHEELPDIVAYSPDKNLLYLIEAFHSTGEWNELRLQKIKRKLEESGCTANTVFFTAFKTKAAFRQKARDIAWETEVWIADNPDHLIHFNGFKFLELHK